MTENKWSVSVGSVFLLSRSKPRRHQVWLNPNLVVEESRNEKNSIEAKRGHDGSGFLLDNEALEDVDYVGTKDSRLPAEAD